MPLETTPAAAAQTPPAAAPPAAPQTVTIPLDQLQAFTSIQARLAEMETAQRSQQEAAQQEQARILAEKGQAIEALNLTRQQSEQAMAAERTRYEQLQRQAQRYALDGELSRALSAQPLASPAAVDQLTALWRSSFVVEGQGESFSVRTPTFQSVGDFVSQQLARPEYNHFLRPGTTGGTATGTPPASAPAAPAHPAAPPAPKNMGEAVILHMQGIEKAQGDARGNMSLPLGLKAVR